MSEFDLKRARRIVLTGGAGFLGRHVKEAMIREGAPADSIIVPRRQSSDLRDPRVVSEVVKGADLVVHLAASVGGIGFNQRNPGVLFYDNTAMGLHLIEESRRAGVKKFVMVGTICAYPSHTPIPFREESLWDGYPEETNAPYGIAKKAMLVMLQAYREQYGMHGSFLLPVNLYGPHDNFDLENSHVIPALIRKFMEAKARGDRQVTLWGDGSPTREFLYVEDAARAVTLAIRHHDDAEPVNLGSSEEISIRNLAELVRGKVGFDGEIVWDTSRPNGQARRKLDVSRAERKFGFRSSVSFDDGIGRTIEWWGANGRS